MSDAIDLLRMPVLECAGSSFERGFAQGVAFRDLVALGIRTWLDARRLTNEKVAMMHRARDYTRERFSRMWEEMKGIARGAGTDTNTVFALNSFNAVPACTAAAIAGTDGAMTVASTLDVDAQQRQFMCVVRSTDEDGRSWIDLRWAGTLWTHAGLNSAGLAIGTTSAPRVSDQDGHGLPQHLLSYAVLSTCDDVPAATELLSSITCTGKGVNLVIADRDGRAAGVEKSANQQAIALVRGETVFRTNHFTAPDLVPFNRTETIGFANSRARFDRLAAETGGRTFDDPVAVARDLIRTHGEGGICQHEKDGLDTLAAAIMSPRDGWIEVCGGKPCRDPWVRWEVNR